MTKRGTSKYLSFQLPEVPRGFCAVYAVGPTEERRPIKIGYSRKPQHRVPTKDLENLGVLALAWFVDRRLAHRVEQRCHRILTKAHKLMPNDWFDIDADWAKKVIAVAAQEEGIRWCSTDDLRKIEEENERIKMGDIERMLAWSDKRMPLCDNPTQMGT